MGSKINAFAPVPFDKQGTIWGVTLVDEFINTNANADLDGAIAVVSQIPWVGDEGGGDSAPHVDLVAGVDGHPGIISLETGATTAADGDIAGLTLANTVLPGSDGIYMASLVRIPDISDTKVSFGLVATRTEAVNSSAANVAALVFDPEDAANVGDVMFFLQLNVGGVDVEAVFDTAVITENEWVLLELAVDNTGAVGRVTTDEGSQVQSVSGALTTALLPGYLVEAVGAAEEVLEIDNFVFRYLRRRPISSYVGAAL
jgi:hypothetical protein